eukprot:12392-Heterococcus_DN1.PRE.4
MSYAVLCKNLLRCASPAVFIRALGACSGAYCVSMRLHTCCCAMHYEQAPLSTSFCGDQA